MKPRSHKNTGRLTNKERAWATVEAISDIIPLIGRQKTAIAVLIQRSNAAAAKETLARNDRRRPPKGWTSVDGQLVRRE